MDIYAVNDLTELLRSNPYPGRGIVLGQTPDGKHAVTAYFIMGRSANSRNRIFVEEPDGSYKLSILKSADAEGSACVRQTFEYPALPGVGHFLHTYVTDGNPIPTFQGEPERVAITGDIDTFAAALWESLNEANKISLFVRFTDLASDTFTQRIFNKHQ